MTANALAFPRPYGAEPLSPAQADASLIAQLRGENAAKDGQIEALIADVRAQANVISDLEAERALSLAITFEVSESVATLSRCVEALVNSGREVVMKFELVADRRSLNVYVRTAA